MPEPSSGNRHLRSESDSFENGPVQDMDTERSQGASDPTDTHENPSAPPSYANAISGILFDEWPRLQAKLDRLSAETRQEYEDVYKYMTSLRRSFEQSAYHSHSRHDESQMSISRLQDQVQSLAAQQTITLGMLHTILSHENSSVRSPGASQGIDLCSASSDDTHVGGRHPRRLTLASRPSDSGSLLSGLKTCASWGGQLVIGSIAAGVAGLAFEHGWNLATLK